MRSKTFYYLHAYARGVDKRITFANHTDYVRFFLALTFSLRPKAPSMSLFLQLLENNLFSPTEFTVKNLNSQYGIPIVNVLAAVLMPNHFHLQLMFSSKNAYSRVLQRLITSYTKYFNARYEREGRLFSSSTKKVSIISDEQNLYLSKYIHTNPLSSSNTNVKRQNLEKYRWSTYTQYLGSPQHFNLNNNLEFDTTYFCASTPILNHFPNPEYYRSFVLSQNEPSSVLSKKDLIDQSN